MRDAEPCLKPTAAVEHTINSKAGSIVHVANSHRLMIRSVSPFPRRRIRQAHGDALISLSGKITQQRPPTPSLSLSLPPPSQEKRLPRPNLLSFTQARERASERDGRASNPTIIQRSLNVNVVSPWATRFQQRGCRTFHQSRHARTGRLRLRPKLVGRNAARTRARLCSVQRLCLLRGAGHRPVGPGRRCWRQAHTRTGGCPP